MKAVIASRYGPPNILKIEDVEKPVPGHNEVLIKVFAATVNRTDCAMLRAKPWFMRLMTGFLKPRRRIPGTDFAGLIEAVGSSVKSFKAGDKVFGFDDSGLCSHAHYMTIAEDNAIETIPDTMNYEEATAIIEGAHYAYNFINKVDIKNGDTVLVNGATGAIGSAAVQLLKYYGADIIAVCESKHEELVKSLGAGKVIDYIKEDFTKIDEKFHFVFDTVGKSTFGKCKPLLLPGGAYISSELGPGAQNVFYALFTPLFGKKKVKFPYPSDRLHSVRLVKKLSEEKKYRAVIDRKYPLERIVEAFSYVEMGQKIGSIVITVSHKAET
jgi:NADPH:quinone reductase-like Zn-dependent oxidoreductase